MPPLPGASAAVAVLLVLCAGAFVARPAAQEPACSLAPPVMVWPYQWANNPVEIRWEPVSGASVYVVYVVHASTRQVVAGPGVTAGTTYVAPEPVPAGPYATIVYAYSADCGVSESEPTLFIVDHPKQHEAALLQDGRVLVAGGQGNGAGFPYVASAQLFDPATLVWSPAGFMSVPRVDHTMTTLDDGRVLSAGGAPSPFIPGTPTTTSVDLYSPATNTWTPAQPLLAARQGHTATLLLDGRVLVTGGLTTTVWPPGGLATTELFDPHTGTWSMAAPLSTARVYHSATRLPDGRVLVAGGEIVGGVLASSEIFDPVTNAWSGGGLMSEPRRFHTAVALADGRVLVAGGSGHVTMSNTADLFDPVTNAWSSAGVLAGGMTLGAHAAVSLADGRALLIGGHTLQGRSVSTVPWVHVFDPGTSSWSFGPPLTVERELHTATVLSDGRVVVAGGHASSGTPKSVEVFDPATGVWTSIDDPWP